MQNNCQNLKQFYENNDKNALGLFFKNYLDFTFRIALYFSKNRSDAEDIVQQVYITILKSKSPCAGVSENDEEKVKGWLAIITANHSKMFLRNKRARKRMLNKSKESIVQPSRQAKPNRQLSLELEEAIDALPYKYRVAILMHYKEGFDFSEIGTALEVKGASVRSLISRGLQKIGKTLAVNGVFLTSSALLSALISKPLEAAPAHLLEKCERVTTSSSKLNTASYTVSTKLNSIWYLAIFASFAIFIGFLWKEHSKEPQQLSQAPSQKLQNMKTVKVKDDELFYRKWVFNGRKDDDIQVIHGGWKYDSTLEAMSYTNKEKAVICSPSITYKQPIIMKYKGFGIVNKTEKYSGGAAFLFSKNGKIYDTPKKYKLTTSTFNIPQGKKTQIDGINILVGPYLFEIFPSKNEYLLVKLSESLEASYGADLNLIFSNLYIQEVELKEVKIDSVELKKYIDLLSIQLKEIMSTEDYKECFQFLKLYLDKNNDTK